MLPRDVATVSGDHSSDGRLPLIADMPTISVFYGVVIQMFAGDHPPPHFHAMYAEHEAVIDLRDLGLLRGSLPRRAMALVLEWASDHRDELMEDWKLCERMQPPKRIAPLK